MSSMFVELQTPLNEYSLVCRGCLAESGEMKNISEWGLTEDFCKLTDVELHSTEGISELLCTTCEDSLMACKRFIAQCKQSDITLRNIAKAKDEEAQQPDAQNQPTNTVSYTLNDDRITYTVTAPDTTTKITLPCPYDCRENYIKKKDLILHLTKRHLKTCDIHIKYQCHFKDCLYNQNSAKPKYFTIRKALNQHVHKVHKEKIYQCHECGSFFAADSDYKRHLKTCNYIFKCEICDKVYNLNERLLVHLMRNHPEVHKQYKKARKEKRKTQTETDSKRQKIEEKFDYMCDSPKRSSSTQTLKPTVKNDVTLSSWQRSDFTKTDEISTQTVFEDLLSLKSQSEDDSLFFSETVSLSDIQTQTFPVDSSSRSNKETLTDPDMSIKETQTCVCLFDSPKPQYRLFDSISCSPSSVYISTETQTQERSNVTDVLLSFNSTETQTCFDDDIQNCM